MAEITVTRGADVEHFLSRFHVTVTEGTESTHHDVTVSASDFERLGANYQSPEEFVRSCFEFLLEREPKESILPSFDVTVIGSYFSEFDTKILRFA